MTDHYPLTQDQVDEISEIFSHFDTNQNKRIETSEFRNLLVALGGEVSDAEVEAGVEALDTNRNGTIEFGEFLVWWSNQL